MAEYDLKALFLTFLDAKVSLTGGEEIFVKEHIEERTEAYNSYREQVEGSNLQNSIKHKEGHP
jgi:PhoPQ-activated pathogenicity-related protein